jgi:hypothetical protein
MQPRRRRAGSWRWTWTGAAGRRWAAGTWRILVGQDAAWLDRLIRARPEVAYDYGELFNEAAVAEYTSAVQAAGAPAT